MPSLDTNVLVRHLVQDDAAQARAVAGLLQEALEREEPLNVPLTVTIELEWVLRTRYGVDKPTFVATLSSLLERTDLSFDAESTVEGALALYASHASDFADCLHVAAAFVAGRSPLVTFDRAAAALPGATTVGR